MGASPELCAEMKHSLLLNTDPSTMGFKRDRGPKPSMFSPRTEFRTLQTEVKLTRKRYLMLLVSGIIYFSNNMQWSSFITITEGTMAYYNVHIFQVNLLSMSYMMFFVFSLITMRIIDKKGVRVGLIAAATLNCVGSLIRVLPYPFMDPRDCQYSYVFLLTGQCISALAMTFLMAMPSLIAARWFGSDERGAMTAVGSQLINLGGAVGFLTSFIIDSEGNGMQTMLVGEALLCTLGLILIYVFIEEEPKYPPTVTAALARKRRLAKGLLKRERKKFRIRKTIIKLISDKNFIALAIAASTTIGCGYAFNSLFSQLAVKKGYTSTQTSIYCVMGVLGGVIVAPIVGRILDCTKSYVPMTAVVMVMFATSILTVMFAAFPGNEVTLSMTVTATGAMYGSLSTVLFEAMAELFYPINPFVANTMVMVLINMVGYLMIAALTFLGEKNYQWYINGDDSGDTMGGDMVFMVMSVMIYCGCFALFSVERVYKRTQAEEIAKSNAMLTGASEYAADVVNPAKMGGFRPTLMYVGGQKKVRDGTTFFEDEADDDEDESNDEEMFIGSVNSINSYRESNYRESSRMQEWDANAD